MTKLIPISRLTVNGNSMKPTLQSGQDVLSFNWAYLGRKPKVGDLVVVRVDGREMVKRVIRIMGDQFVVMGDNRVESTDSRDFGSVKMDQVIGKVVYQSDRHPERSEGSLDLFQNKSGDSSPSAQNDKNIPCPQCSSPVIGIYGRKDALCRNCGFKMVCCGE